MSTPDSHFQHPSFILLVYSSFATHPNAAKCLGSQYLYVGPLVKKFQDTYRSGLLVNSREIHCVYLMPLFVLILPVELELNPCVLDCFSICLYACLSCRVTIFLSGRELFCNSHRACFALYLLPSTKTFLSLYLKFHRPIVKELSVSS